VKTRNMQTEQIE